MPALYIYTFKRKISQFCRWLIYWHCELKKSMCADMMQTEIIFPIFFQLLCIILHSCTRSEFTLTAFRNRERLKGPILIAASTAVSAPMLRLGVGLSATVKVNLWSCISDENLVIFSVMILRIYPCYRHIDFVTFQKSWLPLPSKPANCSLLRSLEPQYP